MEKKLKVAVIGCGRVSRTAHYSSIKEHSQLYEFVGVCDTDKERADKYALETGSKAYYSADDLIEKQELDLVSINVPNGLHVEVALKFAERGINLMIEKPLAMTVEDADRIIDICERKNIKLFTIMQNRYNATNKILKSCVDKGRFGRISTCNVTVSWRRELPYYTEDHQWRSRRDLAGGVFTNQCVHYIDMMQWLVGAPPETVYAKMGTIYPIEVEDHGAGIIKFKNSVIGSLVLTNHAYPLDTEGSITIIGERGMVKLGGKSMNKVVQWDFVDKDIEDDQIKEAETNPPTVYGFGHLEMYERAARSIRGENIEVIDGREGRKAVALLEALYLSDYSGKEIRFPLGKR
ncbi:MAG: Gfo/Idh/MocA family oxidoreductase [Spirochaetia bacterium]|nr:Gfo/Idh/MocA family oxidoreductase [Spirochaetia bacterium]